jgi:hypothetical protein
MTRERGTVAGFRFIRRPHTPREMISRSNHSVRVVGTVIRTEEHRGPKVAPTRR